MALPSRSLRWGFALLLAAAALAGACSAAPEPRPSAPPPAAPLATSQPADIPDDCEPQPGQPPPQPLERAYTGVAAKARCQREVFTIMGGVTHFLGVECKYCHLVPDYRAMTHRKEIANWMASELIPALQKRSNGKAPWCNDCHRAVGKPKGKAKFLGTPRDASFAAEWMTTHLVEDMATRAGEPLHCKGCHRGNLGTPEFQRKVILTDILPG